MPYKIFLDKNEVFECDISVKNASLENAFSRLILETDNISLVFPGKISDNKCTVPIKKLKNILSENSAGKIFLEVIVEDTYFKPWEDNFIVEKYADVKVNIVEQKVDNKPVLEVSVKPSSTVNHQDNQNLLQSTQISVSGKENIKENSKREKKQEKIPPKSYDNNTLIELAYIFRKLKIDKNNFVKNNRLVRGVFKEYCLENSKTPDFINEKFIKDLIDLL